MSLSTCLHQHEVSKEHTASTACPYECSHLAQDATACDLAGTLSVGVPKRSNLLKRPDGLDDHVQHSEQLRYYVSIIVLPEHVTKTNLKSEHAIAQKCWHLKLNSLKLNSLCHRSAPGCPLPGTADVDVFEISEPHNIHIHHLSFRQMHDDNGHLLGLCERRTLEDKSAMRQSVLQTQVEGPCFDKLAHP